MPTQLFLFPSAQDDGSSPAVDKGECYVFKGGHWNSKVDKWVTKEVNTPL